MKLATVRYSPRLLKEFDQQPAAPQQGQPGGKTLLTVRLTDNQKRVIARVLAAQTPAMAGEQISNDANMVAARNLLMKLGLLSYIQGCAEVTEKGKAIAAQLGVCDESGALSEVGQKLAQTQPNGQPVKDGQDQAQAGGDAGMGDMGGMGADPGMNDPSTQPPQGQQPPMESFSLLKELLR